MSIGGMFRFLSPIRKPGEAGELLRAAWRSTKAAANQPDPPVLDGREPSRLLSELRRTVILGLAFTAMFAVMGFSAFHRARRIAAWLERE